MKSIYNQLIGCAAALVSFIIPKIDVDEIILFGSVARGEATESSDIDLFFNAKDKFNEKKNLIEEEIKKFYKSQIYEQYNLRGIKNKFSFEIGNLNSWKLKRSIISEGIVLYGKYKELPSNLKGNVLFNLAPIKDVTKRNRIMRALYGRKEKNYISKGIIKELNGKEISSSVFIIPLDKSEKVRTILEKERVEFNFFEFWS